MTPTTPAYEQLRSEMAAIVESSSDAIIGKNLDGVVTSWNAAAERIFGISAANMIGTSIRRVIPPDRWTEEDEILMRTRRGDAVPYFDTVRLAGDGTPLHVSVTVSPIRDAEGTVIGASKILRDVTAAWQADVEAAAACRKLSLIVASLGEMAAARVDGAALMELAVVKCQAVCSADGAMIGMIRGEEIEVCATSGSVERARGIRLPRDASVVGAAVREGRVYLCDDVETDPIIDRDAARTLGIRSLVVAPLRGESGLVGVVGVMAARVGAFSSRDSSNLQILAESIGALLQRRAAERERQAIEQQTMRAQKMESLGTLAGGIAHDLNNVLAPIMLCLDMLREDATTADARELIDTVASSARRGAALVRQVLFFAEGADEPLAEIQLRDLLNDVARIARDSSPNNITVIATVSDDLWPMLGDTSQLRQLMVSLCHNARDAMPGGGELRLAAENLEVDAQYAAMNIDATIGPHVMIAIHDTGAGIPQAVIERIFDPFFTTKEPGRGTGLGLSTALTIAKRHGGFIRATSDALRGTTIQVYLPALGEPSEALGESVEGPQLPRGNGELVLLVDDEAAIRRITQQTLEAFGYRVLLAADGAEALAVFALHRSEIDVVITDMMMPVMDGRTTITVMLKMNPLVRIVAVSGMMGTGKAGRAAPAGVKQFLAKPYTAGALLTVLRDVLHAAPDAA